MNRALRYVFIATSLLALVLTVGFFLQMEWAVGLWPWPTYFLSNIFIASIFAAAAAPVLWIGLSGERAAVTGGAINFCLMYLGMAAFSFNYYSQDTSRRPILLFALACAALALVCAGLFFWARRVPFRDARPLPLGVRVSFAGFVVLLVLVGGALVLGRANIFPWQMSPEQSVLYGWVFLGAACYFLYGLAKPKWANAKGQLLGFLAYDIVLILPFITLFETVEANLRINLIIYTGVIVYSGFLAGYYLFLNKATRSRTSEMQPLQ